MLAILAGRSSGQLVENVRAARVELGQFSLIGLLLSPLVELFELGQQLLNLLIGSTGSCFGLIGNRRCRSLKEDAGVREFGRLFADNGGQHR